MKMLAPKIVDRDTYRKYDNFEVIDSFEKDWFIVSSIQCTDSEWVEDNFEQWEREWWTDDEITEACWDDESIIITYQWEESIPEYILQEAENYFNKKD